MHEKWWYRLLVVLYIGAYFLAIFLIVGLALSSFPEGYVDFGQTKIACANGNTYYATAFDMYISETKLDDSQDMNARLLCHFADVVRTVYADPFKNADLMRQIKSDPANDYSVELKVIRVNYWDWALPFIIALVILEIVMKLFRISFWYIASGMRPQFRREFLKFY